VFATTRPTYDIGEKALLSSIFKQQRESRAHTATTKHVTLQKLGPSQVTEWRSRPLRRILA